uniref:Uncharacterized protein n=1 Tax=Meloidogyne enterolobii TaxID=390850 RepID=A0A6V7UDS4_MELEN|nr:unnamed protein product [Meloidogyne enterolobii]
MREGEMTAIVEQHSIKKISNWKDKKSKMWIIVKMIHLAAFKTIRMSYTILNEKRESKIYCPITQLKIAQFLIKIHKKK